MDGPVEYLGKSSLGVCFSKPAHFADQHEFRLAWYIPPEFEDGYAELEIGSIESIAEIRTV